MIQFLGYTLDFSRDYWGILPFGIALVIAGFLVLREVERKKG